MNRPSDRDAARRRSRTVTAEPASFAFSAAARREWLTPSGFALLEAAITGGHGLGEDLAHEVARALRGWGRSRGATHVAFLVHPLTGGPREYRLELSRLTGADLVGGTLADAGVRITWDPASPAFIRVDGRGAMLCVPSVLASGEGEALDNRLPLMRSETALAAAAARALRVLGDETGQRVQATVALTRAFELADAEPHLARTRADRVSACVIAAERELDRIGAGVRIGHDELTVLPAATGLACDRLVLALEVLADVAPRYGLVLQAGTAGPDAWSLMAGPHANLLAPGTTPRAHLRFLFFAAAVVRAFAAHGELVGTLDLGPDLHVVLGALARGERFAGSDEERASGAPALPRVPGRATPYGFTGAGFALGDLDLFAATVVNTIVAAAITEQTRALEAWTAAGEDREPAVREVVADAYRRHRHAREEACGGNAAWTADVVSRGRAARRGEGAWRADLAAPAADGATRAAGLAAPAGDSVPADAAWGSGLAAPAGDTVPADAWPGPAALTSEADAAARVFAEQGVMSARELAARRAAWLEEEARVAVERARAYVTPAAILRRAQISPPRGTENRRRAAELDDALRTVRATSRALDAVVAAGQTDGVPPLLEDLRAAAARLTR